MTLLENGLMMSYVQAVHGMYITLYTYKNLVGSFNKF